MDVLPAHNTKMNVENQEIERIPLTKLYTLAKLSGMQIQRTRSMSFVEWEGGRRTSHILC